MNEQVSNRLAAIDGDDGYTGVKPQHVTSLAHGGTVLLDCVFFFFIVIQINSFS